MGIEVHILKATLESLVSRELQKRLRDICILPDGTGQTFIDHLDVISSVRLNVGPSSVSFTIPFDAYVVTLASLEPGAVGTVIPPGALIPLTLPTQPSIDVELVLDGAAAKLICPRISVPPSVLTSFSSSILEAVNVDGELARLDLGPLLESFGIRDPAISRISDVGNAVVLELGTVSPTPRLSPGHQWGIFFDCESHQEAALAMLSNAVVAARSHMENVSRGGIQCDFGAGVTVSITGTHLSLRRGFGDVLVSITVTVEVATNFVAGAVPELQLRANWHTSGSVITGPPGNFLTLAERVAEGVGVIILDPVLLGATPVNDHSFMVVRQFPNQLFGESTLRFSSMLAIDQGSFFLGGFVDLLYNPNWPILLAEAVPFPPFYTYELGCKGTRNGIQPVTAWASLNISRICSTQLLSPTSTEAPLQDLGMYSPSDGSVRISPEYGQILHNLGIQVRVLIRTPRGVRIVNYGVPPDPVFDASGRATNYRVHFGGDCFGDWRTTKLKYLLCMEWAVDRDRPYPPPPQILKNPHDIAVFKTGITRVRVDQMGEALIFERPIDGSGSMARSYFTANANDEVTVPIFVAIGPNTSSGAKLSKLSQADMGVVISHTKTFSRQVTLTRMNAVSHALSSDNAGAIVATTFTNGLVEMTRISNDGKVEEIKGSQQGLTAENRVDAPSDMEEKWKSEIAGVKTVHYIPGFEDEPVAVAKLDSGGYRLLTRSKDGGAISVTGLMPEWPELPPVAGSWAISGTSGTYVSVYRVTDNGEEETKPLDENQQAAVTARASGEDNIVVEGKKGDCPCGCKGK